MSQIKVSYIPLSDTMETVANNIRFTGKNRNCLYLTVHYCYDHLIRLYYTMEVSDTRLCVMFMTEVTV